MPPSRRPPGSTGSPPLGALNPTDDRDARSEGSGPASTSMPAHPHLPPPCQGPAAPAPKPRRAPAPAGARDERGSSSSNNPCAAPTVSGNGAHAHDGIEGISWHLVPLPVLHRYRHAYRLRVPSASSFHNNLILSQGIGARSPSRTGYVFPPRAHMSTNPHHHPHLARDGSALSELGDASAMAAEDAAPRRGRVTREQLATVVRKNFNAQPISESDVIVNFLYSVKNQDRTFRLRFPPR
ncbi:hypothetical protein EV426DRAFT_625010 [Tirmania nivea]|nr:hypothetical protein EV426DRAFT_625010 [Tirmania nivea]